MNKRRLVESNINGSVNRIDNSLGKKPVKIEDCSNCQGMSRVTVGLICPECGRDYNVE